MNKECYMDKPMCKKVIYAKAYIPLQPYENIFSPDDVLKAGTIFMDLYSPYDHHKKCKHYGVGK